MQLGDEPPLGHEDSEYEEMEAELSNVPSGMFGPDILHDETTRLAAGLASQDEGEKLVAISAMEKAVEGKDGENVLLSYVLASPQCAELMNIWLAGSASATAVPLMQLLYHMFRHSLGKDGGQGQDRDGDSHRKSMAVKLRLDKLARTIVRNGMKDIYSHLSSSRRSRKNAALSLLSAMVLRGRVVAIEIATTFDFTLEALRKLARPPRQKNEGQKDTMLKRPTRVAFVDFAMSFLEVGDPGLLRWILQKRPLYAGVLHNISKDSENTMVKVLVLFLETVMAPELMVPRGLQSVLFGDATLDQLARICADETLELAGEFAYDILLEVCTDPSHGLCPESTEIWEAPTVKTGAFGGGQARLLRLMNRLKVTEVDTHRDLLLATGRARPKFAAAYLASIPLSLEPRVSLAWFRAMSLVAMLIPVASQPPPFSLLASQGIMAPPHDGPLIRSVLLSLLPPALSRLALNRGLQHADILVKNACLRVLYEALLSLRRLLEAVDAAAAACCSEPTREANASAEMQSDVESLQMSWLRLSLSIQDTMRAHLPDPNILYGILHSLSKEGAKKRKRTDSSMKDDLEEHQVSSSDKLDYESTILQLWGPEAVDGAGRRENGEILLHSKVMEVLAAFQRVLPIALADTGFDAFKLLPDNPFSMPIVQQNALTTLLLAVTGITTTPASDKFRGIVGEFVGVGSAYKRLNPLLLLMLSTDSEKVSEAAYYIVQRIMVSTGAFDRNPQEIRLWLDALIGWKIHKGHDLRTAGENSGTTMRNSLSLGTVHASIVDVLAEAVGSIGQNIYQYLDQLHHVMSKFTLETDEDHRKALNTEKGVYETEFGPFVICALDTCFRTIRSKAKTRSQRAAVATYVANVLYMLLKCQVHPELLASVLFQELSTETATATLETDEWSPLQILFQHSQELLPASKVAQRSASSRLGEVGRAQKQPEAGKLLTVLKACRKDKEVAREAKLEALRSLLLCIPVEELLDNFPLLMEVCADVFDGDSSSIVSLLGLHQNLLADLSATWPELFSLALELAGAVNDRNGEIVTSNDLNNSALESVDARKVAGAVGLCGLLLACPFSVLFSGAVHGHSRSLFTDHAFTKILQAAALKVSPFGWLGAVRVVISGVKHILANSPDGGSPLDTCFSLLCSFSSPTRLHSVEGNLTALGADGENIFGIYQVMIMDLLNHPALYDIFLCSKGLSSPSCPFVSDLRRDNKDEKVCDTTLKRVLATAASGVNAVDGHILVLLTRVLEAAQILCKSAVPPSCVDQLDGKVFEACGSFVRKAVRILQKEVEESSGLGVVASPSLFAVSVLIPYSDLSVTSDFLLSLLSVGRSKVKRLKQAAAPHVLGLHFATLFIESLSGTTKKPNLQMQHFDKSKRKEQCAKSSESQHVFDLFERVLEQVRSNPSVLADLCLLSFLEALDPKLAVCQNLEELDRGFDKSRFAELARCTPVAVLRHCVMRPNKVTGSIATVLVKSSSVHLSQFGWLIARGTAERSQIKFTGCLISFADKMLISCVKNQTLHLPLSDEDLLTFLPAVKVYLEVKTAEEGANDKEVVDHIKAVYGSYLGKQLKSWDKFVSKEAIKQWYVSGRQPTVSSWADDHAPGRMLEYCHQSPVGQVVQLLRLCQSSHALSNKLQSRLFRSLLSKWNTPLVSLDQPDIAGEDISGVVCEVVAKVDMLRYLLDSCSKFESGDLEERPVAAEKAVNQIVGSKLDGQKDSIAAQRFLASLVYTLGTIYKSGGMSGKKEMAGSPLSLRAEPGRAEWLLFLEQMLLAQVIRTAEELLEISVDLPSFVPVYKYSLATFLGYRYGEPSAMKAARYLTILFLQCVESKKDIDGQREAFNALELLISHSKFLSSMLARNPRWMEIPHLSGKHAGKGTALNSLSSVLLLVGSPLVDHLDHLAPVMDKIEDSAGNPPLMDVNENTPSQNSLKDNGSDEEAQKKIELVKLLRILVTLSLKQCNLDMTSCESPPLEELLSVLLAAYGGTMSELDQEIFTLMQEIESHGGPGFSGLSGLDYVWGEAALKRRKAKSSDMALLKSVLDESDNAMDLRRQTFKEDLLIDPRRCGLTVLFFPPKRPIHVQRVGHCLSAKQFKNSPQEHCRRVVGSAERGLKSAAYDPAFVLPFAVHGLSIGCISAEEFVRLGLLAVAFASVSSADETMRKSGYEVLAKYYGVLESCHSFKGITQIRLLMTYVKNAVAEAWQKVPLVLSVFAAEASCILMNPENHHYLSINRFLLRAPSLDMESIPLFQVMFGSGSVQYRSDRLWMLRLLAAGLGSSLDAHIYRRKFVLELLMSYHDSAMADTFTRKWVLQVLYQAACLRSCSQYLVEHTGLLSWLAIVAVNDCEINSGLQENVAAGELASISLKVIESIFRWGAVQRHLLTDGTEELSKVAFLLHRFLVKNSTSEYQKIFVKPTLSIMTLVLRMSHRRKRYQTHFTFNIIGIQEVINWVEGGITTTSCSGQEEIRTNCLKMILHNSPPLVTSMQDKVLLYDIASWAMQVALQTKLETVASSNIADDNMPGRQPSGPRESICQKLLRWLAAALVLGDMSMVNELTQKREILTTSFTVVSVLKNAESTIKDVELSIVAKLAKLLLSLQGCVNTQAEASTLVTTIAAVARITPFTGFSVEDDDRPRASREKIRSVLEILLSELPCPEEINPSWLWSFSSPWTLHGARSPDEHGGVQGCYVSEVCAATVTFLQLLWSKRHQSFCAYLSDLEACLYEDKLLSSTCDDNTCRVKVFTKLASLQEKIFRVLQTGSLKSEEFNKDQ